MRWGREAETQGCLCGLGPWVKQRLWVGPGTATCGVGTRRDDGTVRGVPPALPLGGRWAGLRDTEHKPGCHQAQRDRAAAGRQTGGPDLTRSGSLADWHVAGQRDWNIPPLLLSKRTCGGLLRAGVAACCVVPQVVEEEIYRKERENGRVTQEPFEVRRVFNQCEWYMVRRARRRSDGA